MSKKSILSGVFFSLFLAISITQVYFYDRSNTDSLEGTEFGNPRPKFDGVEFGNPSKVEKGPFAQDSVVQIQELNQNFQLNGNVYVVSVEDHLGSFTLPSNLKSPLIEVKSTGFYFNEITGLLSSAQLTLGSYSSIEDHISPNINLLTTLAQRRIKQLVTQENMTFLKAEQQAKIEVLKAFHIPQIDIKNFDELTIMGNSHGDAILLAISVSLQGNLLEGELSKFISNIREDLQDNGKIDSKEIYDQICQQTQSLSPIIIRENLIRFYDSIKLKNYQIPFFEDYLDSDCDGIINAKDEESLISSLRSKPDFFNQAYKISLANFQDKVWAYSGSSSQGMQPLSGLYYSEDLATWNKVKSKWKNDNENLDLLNIPIINSHLFSHEDKLWIYGGNIYDPYKTFYKNNDFFYTNNFLNIDENFKLKNLVTGVQFNEKENQFYGLEYTKDIQTPNLLKQIKESWNCIPCWNLLLFQFPDYRPDFIDRKTKKLRSELINHSSTECHKVIKGNDNQLYRFNLKRESCNNYNLHENIAKLNQDGEWDELLSYSEIFYNPIRDKIKKLNLTCEIIHESNPSKYCYNKPESCNYKLNQFIYECNNIHKKYNIKNFSELFILNEIQDIIYFKKNYYFIANNINKNSWFVYQIKDPTKNDNMTELFEIGFIENKNNNPLLNQFYIYENQLYLFNSFDKNKAGIFYSTNNGINWNKKEIEFYNRYIDLTYGVNGFSASHNPFLHKNFIHRILNEGKILIQGKYKYYRDYINLYFIHLKAKKKNLS